jgi:hypothetical protein
MTTHQWVAILPISALVSVLATQSTAQQAPPAPGVIRINVNLVQVDAVVTDNKGKAVTNLKAEDFEVLQDGKPQIITNFDFVDVKDSRPRVLPAAQRFSREAVGPCHHQRRHSGHSRSAARSRLWSMTSGSLLTASFGCASR